MPDFGSPVADQIKVQTPQPLAQTLAGVFGAANAAQQFKVAQAEAQAAQQQMAERQLWQKTAMSGTDPEGNPIKDANGEADPVAIAKFANKYMPLTGQAVQQSLIQTLDNRVKLNDSIRGLNAQNRNEISNIIRSGVGTKQSPQDLQNALSSYAEGNPSAAKTVSLANSLLGTVSGGLPQNKHDDAINHLANQFSLAPPNVGNITGPGGGVQLTQNNPYSNIPTGPMGQEMQQGLSPAQAAQRVPVFQNGQPGTVSLGSLTPGTPQYGGTQGGSVPQSGDASPFGTGRLNQPSQNQGNASFAASGAPIGTPEDTTWMKNDYHAVAGTAATAQQRIGLYNNVQDLAKKALYSPDQRIGYANSLLSLVGAAPVKDLNDATVALDKNAAMIQNLFGGDTDMARGVIQHFTPGSSMPEKVNREIAEYGKANAQMQQFVQGYLKDTSNGTDVASYKDKKAEVSMIADPRLWQFQNADRAGRAEFLQRMTPQQQQQFGALYKKASTLGAFE